ncbi:glycosyltransferase [Candidatus Peregrinibacteria bacterium]|nr:glycosyltransferase [Candidatus Peregrinibacteria bacterium]
MRFALVTPVFYPYTAGMSRVVEHEAQALARAWHVVHVFTPRFKHARTGLEEKDGYTIHRMRPLFSYGNAALTIQLVYFTRGFETIHLHYPFIGGVLWTLLGVWRERLIGKRKKLIITYHMDLAGQGFLKYVFAFFTRLVLPLAVFSADAIRVSSMDYARQSRYANYLFRHPQKLVEIPFGIDTEVFKPCGRSAELLREYSISTDDKVLLFVGALDRAHYFKGVSVLLKALAEYLTDTRIKLVIVGGGDMRSEYEAQARALKIPDRVKFAGFVAVEVLPALYALAHAVVLPSTDSSEAFGMVLVEAQACGTPVVASDLPGVRSVFEEGVTGMRARAGDAKDLARAIKHILDATDYSVWRARARVRAERLYASENEIDWLKKLF